MGIENLDVKTYKEIVQNAAELTSGKLVQERQVQKARIKAILNGGADGIKALLGNTMETLMLIYYLLLTCCNLVLTDLHKKYLEYLKLE